MNVANKGPRTRTFVEIKYCNLPWTLVFLLVYVVYFPFLRKESCINVDCYVM